METRSEPDLQVAADAVVNRGSDPHLVECNGGPDPMRVVVCKCGRSLRMATASVGRERVKLSLGGRRKLAHCAGQPLKLRAPSEPTGISEPNEATFSAHKISPPTGEHTFSQRSCFKTFQGFNKELHTTRALSLNVAVRKSSLQA